ncbi:peptide chain release factor N(5)-glutamine methyltransferase [Cellulomonas cellasea]|uniref:peptide chain release factor N(5)-glutamine methyltransferase n=1 Tax=Cellulomonas cellasea TaxID=43670 RepID=UPI0025A43340|nr:peptide chain release factor N(5)-glutamine methyltransferase [Cellulomonas cellasea]MDM8086363.1 peptide chain release factor N(5)-glutamine methyltransferase [Cellulomonas cellasea]
MEPLPDALPDALREAERLLAAAGVPSPRVDAELLAAHLMGLEAGRAMSRGEVQSAAILGRRAPQGLAELVTRRAAREPLQHLVGTAAFRGLELAVGPGVFVPRPETEQVAEHAVAEALALLAGGDGARVVDLCTGSGAIALAVAHEAPGAEVHAVELDAAAHAWAARNVAAVAPAVRLLRGDARTALRELDGTVDVVVSNPPYVPPGAVPVDPEVAEHDPAVALYGLGADGLEVPRGITAAAVRLLRPGGLFVMEHAEVQDAAARALVTATGAFDDIRTDVDLTGRARMVLARRRADGGVEGSVGVGDSQP